MTRWSKADLLATKRGREALGFKDAVVPARRRGVPGKWEQSFRDECVFSMDACEFEAMRLRIGSGAKGLRVAWYTPDYMVAQDSIGEQHFDGPRDSRPAIIEVKGRRDRAGLVAFRAAAQQFGGWFRFGLAEGGPGNWKVIWL